MSWGTDRPSNYYEDHRQRLMEHERRMYEQARFGLTAPPSFQGSVNRGVDFGVREVEKPIINKVLLLL